MRTAVEIVDDVVTEEDDGWRGVLRQRQKCTGLSRDEDSAFPFGESQQLFVARTFQAELERVNCIVARVAKQRSHTRRAVLVE